MALFPKNTDGQVRIIANYHLITTLFGLGFYLLVILQIIEHTFGGREHVEAVVNTLAGVCIYVGLIRKSAWGWKLTVAATPLSWLYTVYTLSLSYQPGTGVMAALFLFIDAVIITILFRPAALSFFGISGAFWPQFIMMRPPLVLAALFFLTLDTAGAQGAVVISLAIYVSVLLAKSFSTQPAEDNDEQ